MKRNTNPATQRDTKKEKLGLNRESIRVLTDEKLEDVVGGRAVTTSSSVPL